MHIYISSAYLVHYFIESLTGGVYSLLFVCFDLCHEYGWPGNNIQSMMARNEV